jgi:translation elongation factor EF-G
LFLLCRNSNNPILKNHYKKYCRVLSAVIQAAKKLHYNQITLSYKNKVKTAWQIVKTETNKLPSNCNMPPLNIQGNLCHNYQVISDEFNKYFSTMAGNILNKNSESSTGETTVSQSLINLHRIFKHPVSHMTLTPKTPNEISKIIKSLKNKSSTGI